MGFGDGSGISCTICTSLQTDNHTSDTTTPHHSISTDRMLFMMPNQQCHSTEGTIVSQCQVNHNNDRLTAFDPGQPG